MRHHSLRFLGLCAFAIIVSSTTLPAQLSPFPRYSAGDEGEVWQYVGTIGRSVQRCFATENDRYAGNLQCPVDDPLSPADLYEPTGIASFGTDVTPERPGDADFNPADDYRLFVADRYNRRVAVFGAAPSLQGDVDGWGPLQGPTPYGEFLYTVANWDEDGNPVNGLEGGFGPLLESVSVDAAGNLLIADTFNNRVVAFRPNHAAHSFEYLFEIRFDRYAVPSYIALTPGAVVQDAGPNVMYSPTTGCGGTLTSGRIAIGTFSNYGSRDPLTGNYNDVNQVMVYDERMCEVTRIGEATPFGDPLDPTDPQPTFAYIDGLAFDRALPGQPGFGRLYVSDGNHGVMAMAPIDAAATAYHASPAGMLIDGSRLPWGVMVDHRGRVAVAQPDTQRIAAFQPTWSPDGLSVTFDFLFELTAESQVHSYPYVLIEDQLGRWLTSAPPGDVIHVLEIPGMAVIDPVATQSGATVRVEFSLATPASQSLSRQNAMPLACAIDVAGDEFSACPASVDGIGATTATPMPSASMFPDVANTELNIDPSRYARYYYEFPITQAGVSEARFKLWGTSEGGINAPAKLLHVRLAPLDCDDFVRPTVTTSLIPGAVDQPFILSSAPGGPLDVYGAGSRIRLAASDDRNLSLIRYAFTAGHLAAGGVVWHEVTASEATSIIDINVIPTPKPAALGSGLHTLTYEIFDGCNNRTTGTTAIYVDVVPPGVTFSGPTVPADGIKPGPTPERWWKRDVSIGVSGFDDDTFEAVTVAAGPGDHTSYSGTAASGVFTFTRERKGQNAQAIATDPLGNASTPIDSHPAVGFINIDKSAPSVTIEPIDAPNAAGWYRSPVRFRISAYDAGSLSGLKLISSPASPLTDQVRVDDHTMHGVATLSTNGAGQPLVAIGEDFATNSNQATAGVVNVDQLAPTLAAHGTGTRQGGIYQGRVLVSLSASDQAGLSGLDTSSSPTGVFYSINGGAILPYAGAFELTATSTVVFFALDRAGNLGEASSEFTVAAAPTNTAPVCPSAGVTYLWPPNNQFVNVAISGVTDADGDPVTIAISSITQDEPVDSTGDGAFAPDARVVNGSVWVRAERMGGSNGRVYEIAYTASDANGGSCSGSTLAVVPRDYSARSWIDDAIRFDSMTVGVAGISRPR